MSRPRSLPRPYMPRELLRRLPNSRVFIRLPTAAAAGRFVVAGGGLLHLVLVYSTAFGTASALRCASSLWWRRVFRVDAGRRRKFNLREQSSEAHVKCVASIFSFWVLVRGGRVLRSPSTVCDSLMHSCVYSFDSLCPTERTLTCQVRQVVARQPTPTTVSEHALLR